MILCVFYPYNNETVRESDSPSIIRRLSTLLHTSFRWSTRQSFDGSSLNSLHLTRTASSTSHSHTLLRRATSKTAQGSSIIRKDGSVIITKNGKIISVRRDVDSIKRDRSFSGFQDLKIIKSNGICKSLNDMHSIDRERLQLSPLLRPNSKRYSAGSSPGYSPASSNDNVSGKFCHTSLTKIDSVDETEPPESHYGNSLCLPDQHVLHRQSSHPVDDSPGEVTMSVNESQENMSCLSLKSDPDADEVQNTKNIDLNSKENIISTMPLHPLIKIGDEVAKSDLQLDIASNKSSKKNRNKISKSSNTVFDSLSTRFPSLERLDGPVKKCRSVSVLKKLIPRSPLFTRRWQMSENSSCDSLPSKFS
ncbi:hypothetical protein ACF0H5_018882 [Mactra antiquata]